jgi:hypothetical protein
MKTLSIPNNGKKYDCETYEESDLPEILEVFFFWKTAALLATPSRARPTSKPNMTLTPRSGTR